MRRSVLLLVPPLLLAGCYGRIIDAPSLGPRAVERTPIPLPDEAAEPAAAATPALAGKIAELLAQADAGHARYEAARDAADAARARPGGTREGSEAWIAAEEAASARDAARGPVSDAAAALDALRSDPGYAGPPDRAAIAAAAARLDALAASEVAERSAP